jgi:cell division cycle 14
MASRGSGAEAPLGALWGGGGLPGAVEVVSGRLYWLSTRACPADTGEAHFFCVDDMFVYWNFFLDFGPLNLSQTYRFCKLLSDKLRDPALAGKRIYLRCAEHSHQRANSALLLGIYSMLYLGRTPEEAWAPFAKAYPPFPPFHDASPCVCTYHLTVLDCLRGVYKARDCKFFDFDRYDADEAEHYEKVEHGDLNWIVAGRFLAFAGPQDRRAATFEGMHALTPDDYVPYFKSKGVSLVVRLNKKYYDEKRFTRAGIDHLEQYFLDGSTPPDHILRAFLDACERCEGAIAVHCKAGLGRTGTCIGAYLMKHFAFTAAEVVGWLRVCRPGSVIGPQQHYLEEIQERMWKEGRAFRIARGFPPAGVGAARFPTVNVPTDAAPPTTSTSSSSATSSSSSSPPSAAAAGGGARSTTTTTTTSTSSSLLSPYHKGTASLPASLGKLLAPAADAVTPAKGKHAEEDEGAASQGDLLRSAKARTPGGAGGPGSPARTPTAAASTAAAAPSSPTVRALYKP